MGSPFTTPPHRLKSVSPSFQDKTQRSNEIHLELLFLPHENVILSTPDPSLKNFFLAPSSSSCYHMQFCWTQWSTNRKPLNFSYHCVSVPLFLALGQNLRQSPQLFWLLPGEHVHSSSQILKTPGQSAIKTVLSHPVQSFSPPPSTGQTWIQKWVRKETVTLTSPPHLLCRFGYRLDWEQGGEQ